MENKFIAEIRKLLNELDPRSFSQTIMNKYKDIYQDVLTNTSFLDPKCGLKLRLVYYMNNIFEFPKCRMCGKVCDRILKRDNMAEVIDDPYPVYYCSQRCCISSPELKSKIQKTVHEKFGELGLSNPEIRRRSVESTRSRYGVDNVAQLQETKDKVAKTMVDHYGKPYMSQVPQLKQKIKECVLERYGVDCIAKCDHVKQKIKETCLEKYGYVSASCSPEIKQKCVQTNMKKFGVPYSVMLKDVCDKSAKAIRLKSFKHLTDPNRECVIIDSEEEFLNKCNDKEHQFLWKCQQCGNVFRAKINYNISSAARCFKCHPLLTMKGRSRMEQEIADFVREIVGLDVEVIQGSRKIINDQEIDIYIPKFNLAIEFDGLYWHSQQKLAEKCDSPMRFHYNKTEACESKGIHLIHIFEDEWLFKKDIVKSRLRGFLNSYDKRIYARKCKVELLDPKTSKEFVAQNHLQGAVNAKVNLGLFYENELVSVMTFGNFRKSMGRTVEPNCYELLRFCSKLNYRVVGGAGKLFKRFLEQYKPYKVITYADRRWSMGVLYQKLGFQNMKKTSPNYWYVVNGHREYRFKYRKNDLHNLLEKFDPNRTEYENMLDNGIDRVFDCGNYSFDMVFPENEVKESPTEDDKDLLF